MSSNSLGDNDMKERGVVCKYVWVMSSGIVRIQSQQGGYHCRRYNNENLEQQQ